VGQRLRRAAGHRDLPPWARPHRCRGSKHGRSRSLVLWKHDLENHWLRYEREIPRLRRYARCLRREPDHAEDLVQECLLRAIEKIDTWQPGTNLRAWLFVILRNCHINEIRRERRRIVWNDDDAPASGSTLAVPGNQETRVALTEVRNAYLRLSEEHREVLLLVAIEGLQYKEASAILDVPLGTVRSRVSRARQALRQALDAGHGVAGHSAYADGYHHRAAGTGRGRQPGILAGESNRRLAVSKHRDLSRF
jgi:RNA polymerase sigma-70 factor, ECF subfamily